MDIQPLEHNKKAWDAEVRRGCRWTVPVDADAVQKARDGNPSLVLTANIEIPAKWLGSLKGRRLLLLAGGGGQQGPVLAAAGAEVTVYDLSPGQLAQDSKTAEREGLTIKTVQGDMADLSAFEDESFDLIVHPCSNSYAEKLQPVWNECFRVLAKGGELLAGFVNAVYFIFDEKEMDAGNLVLKHSVPYNEFKDLSPERLAELVANEEPLIFGHTLEDQLRGQLNAGFHLIDLYEDIMGGLPIDKHLSAMMATRALKPK